MGIPMLPFKHVWNELKQAQSNLTDKQFEEHTSIIRINSNLYYLSEKFDFRLVDEA